MAHRIGMNQSEIERFVGKLKEGDDFDALAAASGVDPAWFEVNKASLLKLAGLELPAADPEQEAEAPAPRGKRGKG